MLLIANSRIEYKIAVYGFFLIIPSAMQVLRKDVIASYVSIVDALLLLPVMFAIFLSN